MLQNQDIIKNPRSYLTKEEADSLQYGQRIWHLANWTHYGYQKKYKLEGGGVGVVARPLFGTVHKVHDRGVEICPDGADKGTHIWFCSWISITVENPYVTFKVLNKEENQHYIIVDERRFSDSIKYDDVLWRE